MQQSLHPINIQCLSCAKDMHASFMRNSWHHLPMDAGSTGSSAICWSQGQSPQWLQSRAWPWEGAWRLPWPAMHASQLQVCCSASAAAHPGTEPRPAVEANVQAHARCGQSYDVKESGSEQPWHTIGPGLWKLASTSALQS